MGDGIGGPVIGILTNNAFELLVSHVRKDNKDDYGKTEKIIIAKIDNPENPQYEETTQEDLEKALKGKFVSCNVQYRDSKTDALVCNVITQMKLCVISHDNIQQLFIKPEPYVYREGIGAGSVHYIISISQ